MVAKCFHDPEEVHEPDRTYVTAESVKVIDEPEEVDSTDIDDEASNQEHKNMCGELFAQMFLKCPGYMPLVPASFLLN